MQKLKSGLATATVVAAFMVATSSTVCYAQTDSTSNANNAAAGILDGRKAADGIGTGGWLAGSLAGGVLFGFVGAGVSYAIAASSDAELPTEYFAGLQARGSDYMFGFNQGYTQRLKSRRKKAALIGGGTGAVISTAIVIAVIASADDDYYVYYNKVPVLQVSIPVR